MPERVIEETFDQVEDLSLLSQHANSMFCPYLCALLSLPPSLVVFVKVAPLRLAMVKAEDVPKDDFMTKLSEVTGDDAKSRRTLKALREQDSIVDIDDSENKKIVAALSALGVARVNLSAFQSWKEKIRVTETTEHVIWIVKKSLKPNLDQVIEPEWFYDASEIRGRIDKSLYWFVDYNVPEPSRMGKGAMRWKTAISISNACSSNEAPTAEMPAISVASPECRKPSASSASSIASSCAAVVPTAAETPQLRLLSRHPSDPSKDDLQSTEDLAESTEQAFAKGCYVLSCPMASSSAEFKIRMYVAYMRSKHREAVDREADG